MGRVYGMCICIITTQCLTLMLFKQKSGYTSTTEPPRKLSIGDKDNTRLQGESAKEPEDVAPITPKPASHGYYPVGQHGLPYNMSPAPYMPPYITPSPYYGPPMHRFHETSYESERYHQPDRFHQHTPSKRRRDDNIPSSDGFDESNSQGNIREDPRMFPLLSEWLVDLDAGSQGVDGHEFASYLPALESAKYMRTSDIADSLDATRLRAICADMPEGTANKLLSYAKADTETTRAREKRRVKKLRVSQKDDYGSPIAGPSSRRY